MLTKHVLYQLSYSSEQHDYSKELSICQGNF